MLVTCCDMEGPPCDEEGNSIFGFGFVDMGINGCLSLYAFDSLSLSAFKAICLKNISKRHYHTKICLGTFIPSSFHVMLISSSYRYSNTSRIGHVKFPDNFPTYSNFYQACMDDIAQHCYWWLYYIWKETENKLQ